MDKKNGNEMEQIQRGLEEFLEKELGRTGKAEAPRQETGETSWNLDAEEADGELEFGWEEPSTRRGRYGDEELPSRRDGYGDEERVSRRDGYGDEERVSRRSRYVEEEAPPRRRRYDDEELNFREEQYDPEADAQEPEELYDWDSRPSGRRTPGQGQERPRRRKERRERETVPRQGGSRARPGDGNASRGSRRVQEEPEMAKKATKSQKNQKKKRKKKHRLLKFLIVVAVVFAVLGVGLYQLVGVVYGKMTYHEVASVTGASMQEDGVVNILLIGNDSRENGEDGRSDAMILLSVSSRTKTIYMTSLLRDMYVDIPGHDGNRLNAAYSFGGAELLMETIEKNLDISVNRYVLVNFEAFAGLVDAVDGIELELTSEEIEYVNGYLVEYNMLTNRPQGTDNMDTSVSGLVHLNGPQALAYSRNRYLGTDFGRTDRQRKVLTAVIKKLPSALLTNAGGLMDGLLPNLTTNLTQGECFRLSLMAGKMLTYDIVSDSIPQPGTYRDVTIRKMAVLEVDFETNIRYLKEKLYGEQSGN